MCCFLEKQYKPDFYGLNLTIATLDGILKHSNLGEERGRKFYKGIFDSYQKIFWDKNVDILKKEKLNEILFGYISPLTYEGIIVSISDEVAQLCHDIEDIRRLGGFIAVKNFYYDTNKKICELKKNLPTNMQKTYDDFNTVLENHGPTNKLERLYVKLILGICIPIISKVIKTINGLDEDSRERLLKNNDFGKFKNLKNPELGLNEDEIKLIECLEEIFKNYQNTLFDLPAVAKWDMKGKELCMELSNRLYEAFNYKASSQKNGINLTILDSNREDIKKSHEAGKDFEEFLVQDIEQEIDGIPIKFAIWDYLAGMTDNFIIKKYEELTFKRVELR